MKWTYFPLHPETPREGISLEALFGRSMPEIKFMQDRLRHELDREGLPYDDSRGMIYNSRLAQELAIWGDSQPQGPALHHQLYKAYFVDGKNIAEPDILVDLAGQAGLDMDEARTILDQRTYRNHVDTHWQRSREREITAVPTFLLGEQVLVGAHPVEQLRRMFEQARIPPERYQA